MGQPVRPCRNAAQCAFAIASYALAITALAWPGMMIEIDATASTAK